MEFGGGKVGGLSEVGGMEAWLAGRTFNVGCDEDDGGARTNQPKT